MRKQFIFIFLAMTLAMPGVQAKTRISIVKFTDKSGSSREDGCVGSWWLADLGTAFQEMLITKLSEMDRYEILERETIREIYSDEHNLVNSESVAKPKKGKFKVANYTLAGAVSEFEMCQSGLGGGMDVGKLFGVGSVDVGARGSKAMVAVDVRVIDVESGEILKSVRAEGKSGTVKFAIDVDVKNVDFGSDAFKRSPLGKATREAIENAAEKLAKAIPDRSNVDKSGSSVSKSDSPTAAPKATKAERTNMIYCDDGMESNECREVKLIEKADDGDRYQILIISNGKTKWVKKDAIYRLYPHNKYALTTGNLVYLPEYIAEDHDDHNFNYYRCAVMEIRSGQKMANLRCRNGQKSVKLSSIMLPNDSYQPKIKPKTEQDNNELGSDIK